MQVLVLTCGGVSGIAHFPLMAMTEPALKKRKVDAAWVLNLLRGRDMGTNLQQEVADALAGIEEDGLRQLSLQDIMSPDGIINKKERVNVAMCLQHGLCQNIPAPWL